MTPPKTALVLGATGGIGGESPARCRPRLARARPAPQPGRGRARRPRLAAGDAMSPPTSPPRPRAPR